MEKKKIDLSAIAESVGRGAGNIVNKAKSMASQVKDNNEEEAQEKKSTTDIMNGISKLYKRTTDTVKTAADEKAKELELRTLMPIFDSTLDDADFSLTKLIRICDVDKRRAESEVCKGAIGYYSDKDLLIVNIYRKHLDKFGITFYPDSSSEFYYVDPSDRDCYIALDDYFGYMKVVRITELQKIAQDLGAKHFRVTYKEERGSFVSRDRKVALGAAKIIDGGLTNNSSSTNYSAVEIAAEMTCPGHAPHRPVLKYLKRDTSVENLIEMRMDESSPLSHQKFSLKMSNSSGIKESDAIKIDAVLKGFKCAGSVSVVSEAQREARKYLDYEIDFE